ncbi:ThuA domain-containing protein [bacterium]|nr:ThuA domain-containing protein [bacterium]
MKHVLVISAGLIHPTIKARLYLSSLLFELPDYTYHFTTDVEDLCLLTPGRYSSVILFLQQSRISKSALKSLEMFITKGGGLLALHHASSCFEKHPVYRDIIGGRSISKEAVKPFSVEPRSARYQIFSSPKRFVIQDAQLIHEINNEAEIHYETNFTDIISPVVWSNKYFLGKVVYCSLGHCATVLKNISVNRIIKESLDWTCSQLPEKRENSSISNSLVNPV